MKSRFNNKNITALLRLRNRYILLAIIGIVVSLTGCKKQVNVEPPSTSITGASVYNADATATAVLTGIYTRLSSTSSYFGNKGFTTITLFAALSADEMALNDISNPSYSPFYKNELSITAGGYEFWSALYSYIFTCNSAVEGLIRSTSLTPAVKQQLLGEAQFMRAFFYFYLLNLYGDAPLILTTDYKVNASLARSSKLDIYSQIIKDLKDAQSLLSSNYVQADGLSATEEKVRPNKWAATALLARVYLYTGDYVDAETQATSVINNVALFSLTSIDDVFLKNSAEVILQLQPVFFPSVISNTSDAVQFIIPETGPSNDWPCYLDSELVNSFEADDKRLSDWINVRIIDTSKYYYPYKYKQNIPDAPVTEYLTLLRLAEQYLIRAEARVQQNNISGGQDDLNLIRTRAGLNNTIANDKSAMLDAILKERRRELFMELGHRWLDLKRTSAVDAVMSVVTQHKGGVWNTNDQLYPIPISDIQRGPNLIQNQGY